MSPEPSDTSRDTYALGYRAGLVKAAALADLAALSGDRLGARQARDAILAEIKASDPVADGGQPRAVSDRGGYRPSVRVELSDGSRWECAIGPDGKHR